MDLRALLLTACERANVSQAELARRAGSSPSALSAWANGHVSPTVASLSRVLAAAGLQLRASLEPLLAELDARVDEVLNGTPDVDLVALEHLAEMAGAELTWSSVDEEEETVTLATGRITWAFDGATALTLHGLAFPGDLLAICLQFDEAARAWLKKGLPASLVAPPLSYWSADLEQARQYFGAGPVAGRFGLVQVRPVERLPPVIHVQPEGAARAYPVVSLEAVEQAHPALGEVLVRLRTRGTGVAAG